VEIGQKSEEDLGLVAHPAQHRARLPDVGHQVEMGEHGPLGQPRGPAGVLEHGHVGLRVQVRGAVARTAAKKGLPGEDRPAVEAHVRALALPAHLHAEKQAQREAQPVVEPGDEHPRQREFAQQGPVPGPQQVQDDHHFRAAVGHLAAQFVLHVQGVDHDAGPPALSTA
jgi:hypothetical protein